MRKNHLLVSSIILFTFVLVLPNVAGAISIPNPLHATTLVELIDNITNFIFVVGIALVPVAVILAAYNFITAGGDPKKVTTAKNMLLYVFIGVIVMSGAKAVVSIVKSVLGG